MKSTVFVFGLLLLSSSFLILNANELNNEGDLSEDVESDSFLINFGEEGKRGRGGSSDSGSSSGENGCGICVFGKCENQICVCTEGWSDSICTTGALTHTSPSIQLAFTLTGPSLTTNDHVTWSVSPSISAALPSDVSSFTLPANTFSEGSYTISGHYSNTKGDATLSVTVQFVACLFGTVNAANCECREGFSGTSCDSSVVIHSSAVLCKDFTAYAPPLIAGETINWSTNFPSFSGDTQSRALTIPMEDLDAGQFKVGFTIVSSIGTITTEEIIDFEEADALINLGGKTLHGSFYAGNSIFAAAQLTLPLCTALPSSYASTASLPSFYTYEWSSDNAGDSTSIFQSTASFEFPPFSFSVGTRNIKLVIKKEGVQITDTSFALQILSLPNYVTIGGSYIRSVHSGSFALTSQATNPDVNPSTNPLFTHSWNCKTGTSFADDCGAYFTSATKDQSALSLTSVPVGVYEFQVTASSSGKTDAVSSTIVHVLPANAPTCSVETQQPNPVLSSLKAISGVLTAVRSKFSSASAVVSNDWTVTPTLGTANFSTPNLYMNIPEDAVCSQTHTFLQTVTNTVGASCYGGTQVEIVCAPTGGSITGDSTGTFYTQLASFSTSGWISSLPLTYVWSIKYQGITESTLLSSGIFDAVKTYIVPPVGLNAGPINAKIILRVADSAGQVVTATHDVVFNFATTAPSQTRARAIVDDLSPASLLQDLYNPESRVIQTLTDEEKAALISKSIDNLYNGALNSIGGLSVSLFNNVVYSLAVAGAEAKSKIIAMLDYYPPKFPIADDIVLLVLNTLKPDNKRSITTFKRADTDGLVTESTIYKVAELMHGGEICGADPKVASCPGVANIDAALLGQADGYTSATFVLPSGVTDSASPVCFSLTLVDFERDFATVGTQGQSLDTLNSTRVYSATITPGTYNNLVGKRIQMVIPITDEEEALSATFYAAYRDNSGEDWNVDKSKTTLLRRRGGEAVIVTNHLTEFTVFTAPPRTVYPENTCNLEDPLSCYKDADSGFCWNADKTLTAGPGFCDCYSGWGGNQCDVAILGHKEKAVDVSAGSFLPTFELSTGAEVVFTVLVPSVVGPNTVEPTGKSYGTGTFLNFFDTVTCNYPNDKRWTISRSVSGDFDNYTASFSYQELVSVCGLKKYNIPGYMIYNSTLSIARHFKIVSGPFSLSRTASISQKFQIQFPTSVSVESDVKVIDNTVSEFSTLTGSFYDPGEEMWTFTFATATVAPYKLTFGSSSLEVDTNVYKHNDRVSIGDLNSITDCEDPTDNICQQSFELKAKDCTALKFKLNMELNVICRNTSDPNCLPSGTPVLDPSFVVTTSASCPVNKDSEVRDATVIAFRGTEYTSTTSTSDLFGKSESISFAYGFKSAAKIDSVELLTICVKEFGDTGSCTVINKAQLGDVSVPDDTLYGDDDVPLYTGFSVTGSQINDIVPLASDSAKKISIRIDSRITYLGITSKRTQYVSSDVGANIVISITEETPVLETSNVEDSASHHPSAAVSFHSVSLALIVFVFAFLL